MEKFLRSERFDGDASLQVSTQTHSNVSTGRWHSLTSVQQYELYAAASNAVFKSISDSNYCTVAMDTLNTLITKQNIITARHLFITRRWITQEIDKDKGVWV